MKVSPGEGAEANVVSPFVPAEAVPGLPRLLFGLIFATTQPLWTFMPKCVTW